MKIYYSGNCSADALPEVLLRKRKPNIMLTYFDLQADKGAKDQKARMEAHIKRKQNHAHNK